MADENRIHPDAPTDSGGNPVHPEKGYPICGRGKSSKADPTEKSRDDIPYCLQPAGWGADGQTGPGDACKNHGGNVGAPKGPRNGSWKLGLYSEYMTEADAARAEDWLEFSDGDRITIDDFVRMGEKALLFEMTRIERAMLIAPDPSLSNKFCCKFCGWEIPSQDVLVCPNCESTLKPDDGDIPTTAEWVDMHDRQISERIERWMEMLKKYKEVVEGSDLNVNLGVEFEEAIRRADELADADSDERVEFLVGEE